MTTKVPRPILAAGLVAAILTLLLAGCTSNGTGRSSFAGGVDAFPGATTTVTDSSPPSATLGRSSVVLSANGLGPLMFGTQAARALAELTQALGQAEKPTLVPAGSSCGATRMFQWGNLHVLVNEVIAGAGATAGLVGWSLNGGVANPIDFRTDKGIGIGSTLAAVRSAYGPDFKIVQTEPTAVFNITTPSGPIAGMLDGVGAANTVRVLWAGTFCGE
jgi:hypothetical protein